MKHYYIVKESKRIKWYTDMNDVFTAINNRQIDYNWLITDIECNKYNELYNDQKEDTIFITGKELTRILNESPPIQFIWGVFSGIPKEIPVDIKNLKNVPYADGNSDIWNNNNLKIQHPDAVIEIICWDSSLFILLTENDEIGNAFKNYYMEAKDLLEVNKESI